MKNKKVETKQGRLQPRFYSKARALSTQPSNGLLLDTRIRNLVVCRSNTKQNLCSFVIIISLSFNSIPEHVESSVLSQTLQRFDSGSEERMSDDSPSTLKRASTDRRSIIQRYRKLMKRESREFAHNTDENGENFLIKDN